MEPITFREVVHTFSVQMLKDILSMKGFPTRGNKQELIDKLIDEINDPEEAIDLLKGDELKGICYEFGLKTGSKQEMISAVKGIIDIGLFKRRKAGLPLEQLEPTFENIIDKLNHCTLKRKWINSEKDAEQYIFSHLMDYFPTVMDQYNLGGYLALKIDIDIGNGKFGVEVKMSDSFFKQTSEIFRMIGQSVYYKNRRYGENYVLAIVGDKRDLEEPVIKEAIDFMKDMGIKVAWIAMQ